MEKIIVAIRTLNDNLKIVATRVEDLEKRVDAIAARIDGVGGSLTDSIHKVAADTEARLAELTERVYALENATPTVASTCSDDVGDALDDILGVEETSTVVEETPTPTVAAPTSTAPTPNVDDFIAECLGQTVMPTPTVAAPTVAPTVAAPTVAAPTVAAPTVAPTVAAPTVAPTPKPTKTKASSTATSAVQRRAYARQYMVENGAKVEDLRSPAKIEEVMETEEFKKWVAAR